MLEKDDFGQTTRARFILKIQYCLRWGLALVHLALVSAIAVS
jgi:hypothetical protein